MSAPRGPAWVGIGETYTHLLPVAEGRGPDAMADSAFARASAIDPSAVLLLYHPITTRLRRVIGRDGIDGTRENAFHRGGHMLAPAQPKPSKGAAQ